MAYLDSWFLQVGLSGICIMFETLYMAKHLPIKALAITGVALGVIIRWVRWFKASYKPYRYVKWPTRDDDPLLAHRDVMVFAGSFNPPHKGHIETAKTLAKHCDTLYLVIGVNANKVYQVSAADRKILLEAIIKEANMDPKKVKVVTTTDYIWRFCKTVGATELFRSVRTWSQDGASERFLEFQNLYGPISHGPLRWPMPTTFIKGNPEYAGVSSTFIRNCIVNNDKAMDKDVYCASIIRELYAPKADKKND